MSQAVRGVHQQGTSPVTICDDLFSDCIVILMTTLDEWPHPGIEMMDQRF
jgi:hypothetical protein